MVRTLCTRPIREGVLSVGQLALCLPLVFLYLLVDVGLVEEFFFRAILQNHLALRFRSEVSGIFISALLFGVAHGPGLYLPGAGAVGGSLGESPSLWMALAYFVAVFLVGGIFLGVVWARTRNLLLLLMIIHAAGDLLPNYAAMVEMVSGR